MNIPKFRAWVAIQNKMIDVSAIHFESKSVFMGLGLRFEYDFDEVILMQSTGLTDKNGADIFCDDIVRFKFDFESCGETFHHDGYHMVHISDRGIGLQFEKLAWEDEGKNQIWHVQSQGLVFQDKILGYWANDMKSCVQCEVIGNIHANKELLK